MPKEVPWNQSRLQTPTELGCVSYILGAAGHANIGPQGLTGWDHNSTHFLTLGVDERLVLYVNNWEAGKRKEKSISKADPASQCQWRAVTVTWAPTSSDGVGIYPWGKCTARLMSGPLCPPYLVGLLPFPEQVSGLWGHRMLTVMKGAEVSLPPQEQCRPTWMEAAPLQTQSFIRLSESSVAICLT